MDVAFRSLTKAVDEYVSELEKNVIPYFEKEAYGDIDAKLGHFMDIARELDRVRDDESAIQELMQELDDAIGAEHHEQLGDMIKKITAHEANIAKLVDKVRAEMKNSDKGIDTCGCYN